MTAWFPFAVLIPNPILRTATAMVAAALSAGCADVAPRQDGFERTGELIALGGGDAGARGACVTCHGLKGEGDGNLVPRLAGLDPGYFARQMEFYAKGMRRNPQMAWIAKRMDGPAREKLARYYAALPTSVPDAPVASSCIAETLYHEGDRARGLPSCASCHGDRGEGTPGNPALAGQPAPYQAEQLRQWVKGERYGDPLRVMTRISRVLSDAERSALADYNPARRDATPNRLSPEACP